LAQSKVFVPQPSRQAKDVVASEFGIHGDYILTIGSSDPRKNVKAAIEAYFRLSPELQECYSLVVVLAHGALRERLTAQVDSLGLAGRVLFLNSQPHDKLVWLYSAASLFLFLSLYEGFGMPPAEAMACGTPVIVSNLSSLPEVVGDAGVLVDPKDPPAVANAVAAVLQNAALRASLSDRGLRQAAQYSWERTARETEAVYKAQTTLCTDKA
jgi:glycosyltransferase involved in cell wall biosynthesis